MSVQAEGLLEGASDLTRRMWKESWLGRLPPHSQQELYRNSVELSVTAGQLIYRAFEKPKLVLLVTGMGRVFASSAEGRHVTVRYVRPGDCIGAVSVVTARQQVNAEAVTESRLVFVNVEMMRQLAKAEAGAGWVLSQALGDVCSEVIDVMASNVFGSIRSRLARHLLDLAVRRGDDLVVTQDLQEMADAIGSVREVVGRTIRELAAEGFVDRRERALHLLDLSGLHELAIR